MKNNSLIRFILSFLGLVTLIEVLAVAAVLVIGWRLGWEHLSQYAEGLQVAGLLWFAAMSAYLRRPSAAAKNSE